MGVFVLQLVMCCLCDGGVVWFACITVFWFILWFAPDLVFWVFGFMFGVSVW